MVRASTSDLIFGNHHGFEPQPLSLTFTRHWSLADGDGQKKNKKATHHLKMLCHLFNDRKMLDICLIYLYTNESLNTKHIVKFMCRHFHTKVSISYYELICVKTNSLILSKVILQSYTSILARLLNTTYNINIKTNTIVHMDLNV